MYQRLLEITSMLKVDGFTDNGFRQVPIRGINSKLVCKDKVDNVSIEGGVYTMEEAN